MKVFHAARQDLEIFQTTAGVLPAPFFDTQVAAMVCGYGDQAGYETLVRQIARAQVDKSSRFTDWSRRPLAAAQMAYALADVTHLRRIYEVLSKRLEETGRAAWVEEELAVLTDPATYRLDPDEAWTRIKTRSSSPRFVAALRELARMRETLAQKRNVPRARILKDDALLELAANRPRTARGPRQVAVAAARGPARRGRRRDPRRDRRCRGGAGLRVAAAGGGGAAPRRLGGARRPAAGAPEGEGRDRGGGAAADRLERRARRHRRRRDRRRRRAAGWRHEVFGRDALRLRAGEIALSADGGAVQGRAARLKKSQR